MTGRTLPAWWFRPHASYLRKEARCRASAKKLPKGTPWKGFLWTPPETEGPRSLWHPGAARYRDFPSRAMLRTFERFLVGGTTNLEDPTWRKANFLWKFLCAGAAIPDCGGDPIPTAVPPQGFLQSKNALRRRKTAKSAARQSDRCTNCKPVCNCNPERECFLKPQKIISLVRHCMPRTHGISQGSADPCVMLRGKRNTSNFFPAARHGASFRR